VTDPRKEIVRRGYDATAAAWARARKAGTEAAWLPRFVDALRPGAAVLDLGCGHGEPIAAALAAAGFAVTGVDLSAELLRLAAQRVPAARLVHADMNAVDFPAESFGGAVAWDSSFHLPPEEQPRLLARVRRWLQPGSPLLFTAGGEGGELHTEHLGAPMYYGSFPPHDVLRTLAAVGFEVVEHAIDEPGPHGHMIVLARAILSP
jgi:cyclopropane fatty-acyl-phospholipid synthase-like methyltransferase